MTPVIDHDVVGRVDLVVMGGVHGLRPCARVYGEKQSCGQEKIAPHNRCSVPETSTLTGTPLTERGSFALSCALFFSR